MSDTPDTSRLDAIDARLEKLATSIETTTSESKKSVDLARFSDAERAIAKALSDQDEKVKLARAAVQEAYENGDAGVIADAQFNLTSVVAHKERMTAEAEGARRELTHRKEQITNPPKKAPEAEAGDVDTSNRDKWLDANKWYGVDDDMTKAAQAADTQVRALGAFAPGSEPYYRAISDRVRKQFPDRFEGSPGGFTRGEGGMTDKTTGGASGHRIPRELEDAWGRMGFKMDDPKVVQGLIDAQKKAVDKGLLPTTRPTSYSVRP